MSTPTKHAILIQRMANGLMVSPHLNDGTLPAAADCYVFSDVANPHSTASHDLLKHIAAHFFDYKQAPTPSVREELVAAKTDLEAPVLPAAGDPATPGAV